MTQVELVALWAGLISCIVGIVLSIVAIVSSILTNIRLERVTDQTVKSLQKIESDVQRISEETTGLIKAGWERMLGMTSGVAPFPMTASSAKEIAEGLTSEIRTAIEEARGSGSEDLPKINSALREIRNTIAAQMGTITDYGPRKLPMSLDQRVSRLPDIAIELAYRISRYHLTRKQYETLKSDAFMGEYISRLRRMGILVPLRGHSEGSGEVRETVYWFPPDAADDIKAALTLSRHTTPEIRELVNSHLIDINY
jgi:hypothetical protein